jgi:hypothetical protein
MSIHSYSMDELNCVRASFIVGLCPFPLMKTRESDLGVSGTERSASQATYTTLSAWPLPRPLTPRCLAPQPVRAARCRAALTRARAADKWECAHCLSLHALEVPSCPVCGAERAATPAPLPEGAAACGDGSDAGSLSSDWTNGADDDEEAADAAGHAARTAAPAPKRAPQASSFSFSLGPASPKPAQSDVAASAVRQDVAASSAASALLTAARRAAAGASSTHRRPDDLPTRRQVGVRPVLGDEPRHGGHVRRLRGSAPGI